MVVKPLPMEEPIVNCIQQFMTVWWPSVFFVIRSLSSEWLEAKRDTNLVDLFIKTYDLFHRHDEREESLIHID